MVQEIARSRLSYFATSMCELIISLLSDGKPVYEGLETAQMVSHLRPFTKYCFTLQLHTEGDDSPISNEAFAKTEDARKCANVSPLN